LGGNSKGLYKSLNCGKGSYDSYENINKNLKNIARYYDLSKENIITLHQTHSNRSIILKDNPTKKKHLYDGIVTNKKNLILSILTADCAPILFYDSKNIVVGACHAGWKGALSGIIENTLKNMIFLGSKTDNIQCAIGPCIGQKSYYVRKDFYKMFTLKNKKNAQFFVQVSSDHYLFSLKDFIINKLKLLKITDICAINIDTFAEETLCYSNRRSVLKKENDYGRMISTIVIKDYKQ
tara:strand:- start:152 stop:862 length:711 start_codon:yes stop_codon:yes gene_type:complete